MALSAIGLFAVICSCASLVRSDRGFLLTAPRVFSQDAVNELQLSLYDVNAPGEVTVRLLKTDNNTILSEKTVSIEEGTSKITISFPVPIIEDYEARLQIEGEFQTEVPYKIFGEDTVNFKNPHSKIIFIQTDKPIYKTGQEVKFRILPVDTKLKPLGESAKGDVWVEDPLGSRIAQWKNLSFADGIQQMEFLLANEPVLGVWRIFVSVDGSEQSTTFEVKEYVLPKYEVVIKPPPFVLADAEIIPIEVCARYTYGKLVEGDIKVNITLEQYSWGYNKFPTIELEEELNGCYKFDVNVSLVDPEYQYSYRRIQIFAQVTEKGTDVARNETTYIERTQSPLHLQFQTETGQYFKHGLPYSGTIKVTNPDSTPAADEPLEVCAIISRERILSNWWATKKVKYCRNLTSDENGIVSFTVLPQSTDAISMSIEAKSIKYTGSSSSANKPVLYQPQTSTYLRPWYSPSGSHIQVQAIGDPLPCGRRANVQVLFTAKSSGHYTFHYEVISKGEVVLRDSVGVFFDEADAVTEYPGNTIDSKKIQLLPPAETRKGEDAPSEEEDNDDDKCKAIKEAKYVPLVGAVDIGVNVSSFLSPSFHLLVYYIREDRETVADSQQFSIEKCFKNKVNLEFGDEVKQPGTKTTLALSASPNSLCGLRIVDKSINLLDTSNQLTKEKVFQELEMLNVGRYYPRNHCNEKRPQPGLPDRLLYHPRPPHGWSSSSYEDAITAFEIAGFIVISDLTLFTRPCKGSGESYGHGAVAMPSVGVRGGAAYSTFAYPTASSRHPAPPGPPAPIASDSALNLESTVTKSAVDVRSFFPENWLFDIVDVGEDGKLVQKETLPHTITEWMGNAVCINPEDGLGLSDIAKIKGFQEFFVSFTLPYSIVRGEKLPVIVTIFNYVDKCLPIALELEESEEFMLLSDSAKTDICVCGGKSVTFRYLIQPTIIGTLNITVSAKTAENAEACGDLEVAEALARDAITNSLVIEAEGFPVTEATNTLFCPKDSEDGTFKREFSYVLPEDVVEGSERGYLTVSGDIMGPSIDGLDRLVRLPTGCGEQNIVLFAPNVYVLDYLHATGKITEKLKNKALTNLRTGYQRQLKYRHRDGAYSAFGNSDREGSMFVTAFVLRAFSQASKYIDIDAKSLEETSQWILTKQAENGCFPEVGRTLSYSIKGGIKDSNTSTSLTAYVLTALLTSGLKNDKVVNGALSCLETEKDPSPYQAALFAFAAALAGNKEKANEYLEVLHSRANTTNGVTYFPNREGHLSVEIETAAYAVLAQTELDLLPERSLPIVRWMTTKRNSNGGFSGTQDTVLALESLSEFATLISNDPVDLSISASGSLVKEAQITEEDRLVLKKYQVPEIPTSVTFEATGSGCGLVQASLHYNTKEPRKQKYFYLEVETSRSSSDCKYATIGICTSYLPEGKKSSMALVQIKMISGMVPVQESLQTLKGDRDLELKRYEVENNELILYFDELTNTRKCFEFTVEEVVPVVDSKPGNAIVYDYYAKEREEQSTYSIDSCA